MPIALFCRANDDDSELRRLIPIGWKRGRNVESAGLGIAHNCAAGFERGRCLCHHEFGRRFFFYDCRGAVSAVGADGDAELGIEAQPSTPLPMSSVVSTFPDSVSKTAIFLLPPAENRRW